MLFRRTTAMLCALMALALAARSATDGEIPFDTPGPVIEIPEDALPPGELDVLKVRSSDPAMNRAFGLARASLPAALSGTEKKYGFFSPSLALYVAVRVDDPDKRIEFVWVDNIRRKGKGFTGKLASQPRFMPGKRLRAPIDFLNPQIADWAVQARDGRYYGYFTTRARLKRIEEPLASELRALLVDTPVPQLWQ
ncbi:MULTISPECIES: DUF2314 domain-containing protein [Mameliella]|uniref:DUF2314 domain-containing protein n=1 Tax=Mameliella TaxID=1434019 RepID=UPI000B535AFA|nr:MULTISPECIES: DUF2314 domain-containing protein [Mameliella]MCR9273705.1 DUF2314 domain-containing protein [Paracoccaceae bacterium]OWV56767.1 hypothetical protein CDZ98_17265 [Mameliella alba]